MGKLTTPNDGDLHWGTGDGFPDWADGFNAFAPDPRDDLMLEGRNPDAKRFVPVRITLPAVSYGSGKLWFEYDASDPVYGSFWAPGEDERETDPTHPDYGTIDPRDMRT